jgi:hypothetical protein
MRRSVVLLFGVLNLLSLVSELHADTLPIFTTSTTTGNLEHSGEPTAHGEDQETPLPQRARESSCKRDAMGEEPEQQEGHEEEEGLFRLVGPCFGPEDAQLVLVSVLDGVRKPWDSRHRENRYYYCQRHGYVYCELPRIDPTRRANWSKILAIYSLLSSFERVVWYVTHVYVCVCVRVGCVLCSMCIGSGGWGGGGGVRRHNS